MNRVLNKDFVKGSYTNSTLNSFFWCFSSCIGHAELSGKRFRRDISVTYRVPETQLPYHASRQGESDEE